MRLDIAKHFFTFKFLLILIFSVNGLSQKKNVNNFKFDPDLAHLYKGYKLNNFLNFGPLYNDNTLLKCDDCYEGPVKMNVQFPFMGVNYSSFYINSNGVVSFEASLEFPEEIFEEANVSYIAPLWIDVDTRFNGDCFHREIIEQSIKTTLENEIKEAAGLNEFKVKFVYCITWFNVEPFLRYNEQMNNSFQTILVTDEQKSFVLFQYDSLTWPNYVIKKSMKTGFFNSANNLNSSSILSNFNNNYEIDLSRSNKILLKLQRTSNMKQSGRWILRLDQKDTSMSGFVDFGFLFGDRLMLKNDDGYEGPIQIPFNLNLSNKPFNSFYINTNGLISFERQLSFSGSITNPLKVSYIAPFWADIDNRKTGYVFHREINEKRELEILSADLNQVYNSSFALKWAYVITWSDVEAYVRLNEIFRNTFQLVLTYSDNGQTFAVFNYRNVTWPNRLVRKNLKIGFNLVQSEKNLQCFFTNFEDTIFADKKNNKIFEKLINGSNVHKIGKWILRLDKNGCDLNE